jgi:hypothetical protein
MVSSGLSSDRAGDERGMMPLKYVLGYCVVGVLATVVFVLPALAVLAVWFGCVRLVDGALVWEVRDGAYTLTVAALFALGVWLARQ